MSNTDSIEVSGATVEEAVQQALEQLGAAEDDVVIEVLATPRAGVLGLGARDARVRVRRRPQLEARSGVTAPPPAPPPQSQAPPATRPEPPRAERPQRTERAERTLPRSESAPPQPRRQPPRPQPPRAAERSRQPAPIQETETEELSAEAALDDSGDAARRSANTDEQAREAISVLARILELMKEKSEIQQAEGSADSIELEIRGDGSGILIGRHGQTLDALEYVLNRIIARRIKDAIPIQLDTESYRARRRQQLHRMALSMGERAKRDHEPVKLDPMPPRDRRIIHLALKDDPMLTTRSAGDGFLRSVEIVPAEGRRERSGGGRENKRERERERERDSAVGEQGGFKHGQKRLF
jgi:spoIIIJ-associated protein